MRRENFLKNPSIYTQNVTINKWKFIIKKVNLYSIVEDFPILFKLDSKNFKDFNRCLKNNNWRQLFFYDVNETLLQAELEYIDEINEKAQFWIRIPKIEPNKEIVFYLVYDKNKFNNFNIGHNEDTFIDVKLGQDLTNTLDIFNDNSCIACWPLDGNANELSGNYNGTWSGNETYINTTLNKAAKFDGNSYISIPPITGLFDNNTTPWSVSCWFKFNSMSEFWSRVLDFGFNFILAHEAETNYLGFHHRYNSDYSGVRVLDKSTLPYFKIEENKLYHIILTYDTNNYTFYINNVKFIIDNPLPLDSLNPDQVGYYLAQSSFSLDSLAKIEIDQVRIFNKAISDSEANYLHIEEKKLFVNDNKEIKKASKILSFVPYKYYDIKNRNISITNTLETTNIFNDNSCIAYFPFTSLQEKESRYTATLYGEAKLTNCYYNGAVDRGIIKNTTDYCRINNLALYEQMAFSFWVYKYDRNSEFDTYISLADNGTANRILFIEDQLSNGILARYAIEINDVQYTFDAEKLELNSWIHLVINFGSIWQVYKNGELIGEKTAQNINTTYSGDNVFIIGQEQDSKGGGFDYEQCLLGKLGQLRIYNRNLTETEVKQLYKEIEYTPYNIKTSLRKQNSAIYYFNSIKENEKISSIDFFNDNSGVALWKFDKNVNEEGGNYTSNIVTTSAALDEFVPGKLNYCFNFNGETYIDTSLQSISTGYATVSFWFNIEYQPTDRNYFFFHFSIDNGNEFCLLPYEKNSTQYFVALINGDKYLIYNSDEYFDGKWHHCVFDSQYGNLYIDCVKVGSANPTNIARMNSINKNFIIGADRDSSSINDFLIGKLDQFRVFNKILSKNEIYQLYKEGLQEINYGITSNYISFTNELSNKETIKENEIDIYNVLIVYDENKKIYRKLYAKRISETEIVTCQQFSKDGKLYENETIISDNFIPYSYIKIEDEFLIYGIENKKVKYLKTKDFIGFFKYDTDITNDVESLVASCISDENEKIRLLVLESNDLTNLKIYDNVETYSSFNYKENTYNILETNIPGAKEFVKINHYIEENFYYLIPISVKTISNIEKFILLQTHKKEKFGKFGLAHNFVWNDVYEAVFHTNNEIKENLPSIKDSTISNNHGTPKNGVQENYSNLCNKGLNFIENFNAILEVDIDINYFEHTILALSNSDLSLSTTEVLFYGELENGTNLRALHIYSASITDSSNQYKKAIRYLNEGTGGSLDFLKGYNWLGYTKNANNDCYFYINDIRNYSNNIDKRLVKLKSIGNEIGSSTPFSSYITEIRILNKNVSSDYFKLLNETIKFDFIKQYKIENKNSKIYEISTVDKLDVFEDGSSLALWKFENSPREVSNKISSWWINNENYNNGKFNKCAYFDGNGSYIRTTLQNINSYEMTISFWYNFTKDDIHNAYSCFYHFSINGDNTFNIWVEDANKDNLNITIGNSTRIIINAGTTFDGNWHHLVITTNPVIVYIDTIYKEKTDFIPQLQQINRDFLIGCDWDSDSIPDASNDFKGNIDQFRIFRKILTLEEIKILYNEQIKKYD